MSEIGIGRNAKLLIYLPAQAFSSEDAQTLPLAIHNYFAYRSRQVRRDLRATLRIGAISLLIGLAFLFVCLSARSWVQTRPARASQILAEGLLIMGWVAMWRPIDVFLYDWWPIARKRAVLEYIAAIPIELRERA